MSRAKTTQATTPDKEEVKVPQQEIDDPIKEVCNLIKETLVRIKRGPRDEVWDSDMQSDVIIPSDSFEGASVQSEEAPDESEDVDESEFEKKVWKQNELIHVYAMAKGRNKGFLPSIQSKLGSHPDYLYGVMRGQITVP